MVNSIIFLAATLTTAPTESQKIEKTLDGFHQAASEARFDDYFKYFSKDAVFIGTDASERWTIEDFRNYVKPHFAKGKGWTYEPKSRHISLSADQKLAWFDELLDNEKYGVSRGSGVLVLEMAEWKIAQYHLTFPIPNELAAKMTSEIKAFEKAKTKSLPKANR